MQQARRVRRVAHREQLPSHRDERRTPEAPDAPDAVIELARKQGTYASRWQARMRAVQRASRSSWHLPAHPPCLPTWLTWCSRRRRSRHRSTARVAGRGRPPGWLAAALSARVAAASRHPRWRRDSAPRSRRRPPATRRTGAGA